MTKFRVIEGGGSNPKESTVDWFDKAVDDMIEALDTQHDEMANAHIRTSILRFTGRVGVTKAIMELEKILGDLRTIERNTK